MKCFLNERICITRNGPGNSWKNFFHDPEMSWERSMMASGVLCPTLFLTVRSEEGAHRALAPILHSENCSWAPALGQLEKTLHDPECGFSALSFQSPDGLSIFPRTLPHPRCQNWAHLPSKEVKGRGMVGGNTMPRSWPAGPLWIQESLPAVCSAPLARGYRNKHFSLESSPLLKTIMAMVRGSYRVLWECPWCRH